MTRASGPGFQIKAYAFRGVVTALEQYGHLDEVASRVPPATRELLRKPPPASEWIDATRFADVNTAILDLYGEAVLRRFSRESASHGAAAILRPVIEGFLRIFGATPATLFTRLGTIASNNLRGAEITFASTGARSGTITFRVFGTPELAPATAISTAGSLEIVFDYCGVQGTIATAEIRREGNDSVAVMRASW